MKKPGAHKKSLCNLSGTTIKTMQRGIVFYCKNWNAVESLSCIEPISRNMKNVSY